MTQATPPQTFEDFCDTLTAALPDPRLMHHSGPFNGPLYLHAAWTGPHDDGWQLTADVAVFPAGGIEIVIESAHSTTKLGLIHHATDVITMLRALRAIETPDAEPSPVGVSPTPVDPTREVAPEAELERLRDELESRDWFAPDGVPIVTFAASLVDGLGREQARVRTMACQRGKILGLCRTATRGTITIGFGDKAKEEPWWTLNPADVVQALGDDDVWPWDGVADPWAKPQAAAVVAEQVLEFASQLVTFANRLNGVTSEDSMRSAYDSHDEEILRAYDWAAREDHAERSWDDEDRAVITLVRLALADLDAGRTTELTAAVIALVNAAFDDEEEREETIAAWRAIRAAGRSAEHAAQGGERWDASVPPGGYVCATCGTPTESEPCPEHGQTGGMPEPCQPIGCDNGYHRDGCAYATIDSQPVETTIPFVPEQADERG